MGSSERIAKIVATCTPPGRIRLGHVEFVLHLGHCILELLLGRLVDVFWSQAAQFPARDIALSTDQMQAVDTRPLFQLGHQFVLDQNWFHRAFSAGVCHLANCLEPATFLRFQLAIVVNE